MYVIPTFHIKTKKTKDEIVNIFKNNTQEIDIESVGQNYINANDKKFFIGNINQDNFYLKRNNIWGGEIGVKIIDNQIDRSIQYQLGAGDFLRILCFLWLVFTLGIGYVLEEQLHYSSKLTGGVMGLVMILMFILLFVQRVNADKEINRKFENLFKD